ncbi:MAG: hypothetical protein RL154_984 [Pseudomonadota bacterium]|jgi:type VI secretion system protein ImpB
MGKEASVAPKERVNITYKPAIGDAKEEVELPLKMLVCSDFTGKDDARTIEDRKPINVDKDNFNDVLKASNLNLVMGVEDKISGIQDGNLSLDLKFENIKDFDPDSIIEQVPQLKQLLELRNALKALKGPLGNTPEFKKKIQEIISNENTRAQILQELNIQE